MSASAILHPRHIFGLRGDVRENVHFIDESTIAYAAGHQVVLHNLETRAQKFLPGSSDGGSINCIAVAPNKRYLAIAERGERAVISIFDLQTMKRRKILTSTEIGSKEYVSIGFSPDSTFLAAQGGAPEWNLTVWQWEKSKLSGIAKGVTQAGAPVCQVLFGQSQTHGTEMSPNTVSIVGNGVFRCFRSADSSLKPLPALLGKLAAQTLVSHAWLRDAEKDRVFLGASSGEVLMFEGGEHKGAIRAGAEGTTLTCMLGHSKGMVSGTAAGSLVFVDREGEDFRNTGTLAIPGQEGQGVVSMALSPSEECLVVILSNSAVYSLDLTHMHNLPAGETPFKALLPSFHVGPVTGVDMCVRRPVTVTCGADRTVRLWNYAKRVSEQSKSFGEDVLAAALHPASTLLLLGFATKLRLFTILMEDIRLLKEFPIKMCKEVRFSSGGQFFAAVNNSAIQIYNSYTAVNIGNLRGHNGKVRSISWSPDDTRLASTGVDGAVYEWRISTMKRERENVLKGCNYSCAITTGDDKAIYAVGSDKKLKHLADTEGPGARTLFAGTEDGCIRCYKFPLTGEYQELRCCSGSINRLRLSHDDSVLCVGSDDGCLLTFDVRGRDVARLGKGAEQEPLKAAEEVPVLRADIEERRQHTAELEQQVKELVSQGEYQLRLKDLALAEREKELRDEAAAELAAGKARFEALQQEKRAQEVTYEARLTSAEERASAVAGTCEARFQAKLLIEVDRYQGLAKAQETLQAQWQSTSAEATRQHDQLVADVTLDYEQRLDIESRRLADLASEKASAEQELRETQRLGEENADAEIEEQRSRSESRAAADNAASFKMKGENGILRKRFATVEREMQSLRDQTKMLTNQKATAAETTAALQKDIEALKAELLAREATIGEKEVRIREAKHRMQELEKLQFVLESRIEDLRGELAPKDQEVAGLQGKLKELKSELEAVQVLHTEQGSIITDVRSKNAGLQHEVKRQQSATVSARSSIKRFQRDVADVVAVLTEPAKLKDAVLALYKKYKVVDPLTNSCSKGEKDADSALVQDSASREMGLLQKAVEGMKRKATNGESRAQATHVRMLQENAALIKEINELRRELHAARRARSTPQNRHSTGKPVATPAVRTSMCAAAPAAAPSMTAALMATSARRSPVSSAVEELARGQSSDMGSNNAVAEAEEGGDMDEQDEDSVRNTRHGILAIGTASASQSGNLDIFLDCALAIASQGDGVPHATLGVAACDGVATELSSFHATLAAKDERIRQLEAAVAQGGECSLRQPPDMTGWSAAAIRSAGPTGSGPST